MSEAGNRTLKILAVAAIGWTLFAIVVVPLADGKALYRVKDWGALTSGGVGPGGKYDVYVVASGAYTCQVRAAIQNDNFYLPKQQGDYALVRIDYYFEAPGWWDEAVVDIGWYMYGEAQERRCGGTCSGRLTAEVPSPGVYTGLKYFVKAWGYDGGQTCYTMKEGWFQWS